MYYMYFTVTHKVVLSNQCKVFIHLYLNAVCTITLKLTREHAKMLIFWTSIMKELNPLSRLPLLGVIYFYLTVILVAGHK